MTKAETIFAKELSQIHDQKIKSFVITCFDKLCPDYFWTCSCSTTGKYHPQVSLGVGGLVRHTKLAVWWGIELLEALALGSLPGFEKMLPFQLQDEVIATLLMHDMIKNGKGLNTQGRPLESGVTGTHGVTLAKRIQDIPAKFNNSGTIFRVLDGIAGHMGIWTTCGKYKPSNILDPINRAFANLIHLADYCASRKVDEIYRKLQGEQDDPIKQTAEETRKSPPCPGVCSIESREHPFAKPRQDSYL